MFWSLGGRIDKRPGVDCGNHLVVCAALLQRIAAVLINRDKVFKIYHSVARNLAMSTTYSADGDLSRFSDAVSELLSSVAAFDAFVQSFKSGRTEW
jgi:hypothetical protein